MIYLKQLINVLGAFGEQSISSLVSFCAIATLISGCGETFGKKLEAAQFTVERQDIANYRVKIEIPEGQTLSIYRRSPFTQENTLIATNRVDVLFDETAKSGELYRYVVGVGSGKSFKELYRSDVKIPLDIVSSHYSELPQHYFQTKLNALDKQFETEVGMMVLDEGFPFYLNGAHGKINIKKLISNEGEIATFMPGAKAEPGNIGGSGGPLRVKIVSGEGEIKFTMRGQHGGDGLVPQALGEEGRGAKGSPGSPGNEHETYFEQFGSTNYSCRPQPTSGGKGGKGLTGLPGNQGLRGGDSGELYVELGQDAQVSISVEKFFGLGGQGSLGGVGGPGGHGGPPGEVSQTFHSVPIPDGQTVRKSAVRSRCNEVSQGEEGDIGDRGPSGPVGDDGVLSKSCIKNFDDLAETCEL